MDEGAKKQRINLTLNPDLVAEAESYRVGKNIGSLSALVELALRREMASNKSNPALSAIKEHSSAKGRIVAFTEIPLLHAAAGEAIDAHSETYQPASDPGRGRFAVQLHGDSMWPKYPDGSVVILREREGLRKPVLKRGEIYLFDIGGNKTLKVFSSRPATKREIALGLSYVSKADGKEKVRVLKALNPAFDDIRVTDDVQWIGWLDKKDN